MAVNATPTRNDAGIARSYNGKFTGDGGIATVTMGNRPKYVKLINITDGTVIEKTDDMTDAQTLKTAGSGALSVATDSAIVFTSRGFAVAAGSAVAAKNFVWFAN